MPLIALLATITLAGSAFMIFESAGYYSMVYSPVYIAWGAAIVTGKQVA